MGPTFFKLLEGAARQFGNREFMADGTFRATFHQLYAGSRIVAKRLHEEGVGPGDLVLVCVPNWIEYLHIYAATSACKAVFATCSVGLKRSGFLDLVDLVNPRAVFVAHEEHLEALRESGYGGLVVGVRLADPSCLAYESIVDMSVVAYSHDAPSGLLPLADLPFEPASSIDVSTIIFTSGSTGAPKGVMSTAFAHDYVSSQVALSIRPTQDDVFFVPVSFCHIFGLCNGILIPLKHGSRLVVSDAYSPARALDLIDREGCTIQFGVPTMYIRQLRVSVEQGRPYSLRAAITGGAKTPEGLICAYEEKVGCRLLSSYGMSETTGGVTATYYDDLERHRAETDGLPIDGALVRILSREGEDLPCGQIGEIAVKTPGIMAGYYTGGPVVRDLSLADAWFRTGDLGWLDAEGYVHTTGRIKDMIIRGGINIFPHEVEVVYKRLPALREVCLMGYASGDLGERTCLVVSFSSDEDALSEDELRQFGRDHLEKDKVPDKVLVLPELPRLHSGKLDKVNIRVLIESRFGQNAQA